MKRLLLFLALTRLALGAAVTISGSLTVSGSVQMVSGNLSAPQKAISPSPTDGGTRAALAMTLSWANGGGATSYNVLLDTVNPPVTQVATAQAGTTYAASLAYSTTYYERVDSKNSIGTTTGDVWSFTTLDPAVADSYTDMETGAAGDLLTAANVLAGTHGSIGTWSMSTNGALVMKISSQENTLTTPVKVGATVYTDAGGTRGFDAQMGTVDETTCLNQYILNTFTVSHPIVSWAFAIKLDTDGGVQKQIDLSDVDNSAGGFAMVTFRLGGNGMCFAAHTGGGAGVPTGFTNCNFTPSFGTWYKIRAKYVSGDGMYMKVFSDTGTTPLDTVFCSNTGTSANCTFQRTGRPDNHVGSPQPPSTSFVHYDDLATKGDGSLYDAGP